MYGTVARLRPRPGQEQGVIAYAQDWERDRKPHTPGALNGYIYQLANDPGVWLLTMAFTDKASYEANAASPQMDSDYQRLRALLLEDPEWMDGEIMATL